jgi:acyl-coenzyme A thioesterase PaaI-like protein
VSEPVPTPTDAPAVDEHVRSTLAGGSVLPPHYPTCLGCGPDAEQGFHLRVRREGDEVVAEHVFEPRHSGAPGIAHGGAVATVVDDVLGFLLYLAHVSGVTRILDVEYLEPVVVGVPYTVRGRLDRREGRNLWVSCAGTGPDGVQAFRGRGLFLAVDLSHFSDALTWGGGQDPVAP